MGKGGRREGDTAVAGGRPRTFRARWFGFIAALFVLGNVGVMFLPSLGSTSAFDRAPGWPPGRAKLRAGSWPQHATEDERCAGRGHRLWVRVGDYTPLSGLSAADEAAKIESIVIDGASMVVQAFGRTGAADAVANESDAVGDRSLRTPYQTAVSSDRILVTDACLGDVAATSSGEKEKEKKKSTSKDHNRRSSSAARVDLVIPHMDGAAPGWMDQAQIWWRDEQPPDERFRMNASFRDNGRARYVTRSIIRFAAHVVRRIIFIVPDESHLTNVVDDDTRMHAGASGMEIVVVKHDDLFSNASLLPTFNPLAVESLVHRIPGLSPFYIFLDGAITVLGRPLSWLDLLRPVLVEIPHGLRPRGLMRSAAPSTKKASPSSSSSITGLLRLPLKPGHLAVPVLARREGASTVKAGKVVVYIELETIPAGHDRISKNAVGVDEIASSKVNVSTIDPAVAAVCKPQAFAAAEPERTFLQKTKAKFSLDRLLRRNRELVWNYAGVLQTHNRALAGRLVDRKLMALMLDGDGDNAGGDEPPAASNESATSSSSLLPDALVRSTRSSRFPEDRNVFSYVVSPWLAVAENRRRRMQLLEHDGYEWAEAELMQCADCGRIPNPDSCPMRPSRLGERALFSEFGVRHGRASTRLLAPVVGLRDYPELLVVAKADSMEQLRNLTATAVAASPAPPLWTAVLDAFESPADQLPAVAAAFEELLRALLREPASSSQGVQRG